MINTVATSKNNLSRYPVVASLDVHDKNIYVFICNTQTGEILVDTNIIGRYKAVEPHLQRHCSKKKTMVIYEAGGHGFAPFRYFTKCGYACKVIAPSSIPKRGKDKKTDRDDARANWHYHTSGLLAYVNVPDENFEDAREYLRFRTQVSRTMTRQKQRIQAMIKRQGVMYDLTATYWTKKHYAWLKSVQLPTWSREVLNIKLLQLDQFEAQLIELDGNLDRLFDTTAEYKQLFDHYTLIPGIGRIGAMTLILDGGDINRFPRPTNLMSYVGLFPGKLSSSSRDPALRITKAGNSYLRYAIVNAAKYYRDRRLLLTQKQIATMPKEYQDFITRMQNRLNSRHRHLTTNGKKQKVAQVAVARELC